MTSIALMMMLFIKSPVNKVKHIPFRLFILLGFVAVFFMYACNTPALYEKNIHLESGIWNLNNKLAFDVSIQDSIVPHDFYLNIRHNDDFEFSNLYLFVDTYYPASGYTRDTIEILLADPTGKWYGEGFGSLKEVRVLLKKGVSFPSAGDYTFSFIQAMRTEDLNGIEDFGIRIEKIK